MKQIAIMLAITYAYTYMHIAIHTYALISKILSMKNICSNYI